jgi:hypothetical protein
MFEKFTEFEKVFVTGPQRSGTRICAKMIAADTGFKYVDEEDFNMDSLYVLLSILYAKKRCVVHCPVLCRYIHFFASPRNAIVLLRRDIKEIIRSQRRIKWSREKLELLRYDLGEGIISEVKYEYWDKVQKARIKNAFEIKYDSLKSHPLWIEKKERRNFLATQIDRSLPASPIPRNALLLKTPEAELFLNPDKTEGILKKGNETFQLLNKCGLLIWDMCDGTNSTNKILKKMQKIFLDIEKATLLKDTHQFIHDLHAKHFISYSI